MAETCTATLGTIERNLAMAERHIAEAERHLASQREIILSLETIGSDTRFARKLLVTFEVSLSLHMQDRERLQIIRMETEKLTLQRTLIALRAARVLPKVGT